MSRVRGFIRPPAPHAPAVNAENQELGIYWDPEFAKLLETWGEGNMWNEIQLLLVNCSGRVLDCACGTGTVIERLRKYPRLEVHGFDISDFLIGKALERGIPRERLTVADATQTPYPDERFDYSYSIGSMGDGIGRARPAWKLGWWAARLQPKCASRWEGLDLSWQRTLGLA